jgi:drug/metabolite transporter (DMT)-like permease
VFSLPLGMLLAAAIAWLRAMREPDPIIRLNRRRVGVILLLLSLGTVALIFIVQPDYGSFTQDELLLFASPFIAFVLLLACLLVIEAVRTLRYRSQ